METAQNVAARLGAETALKWADHRMEALEAEVRSNLQALRALSEAVLSGEAGRAAGMARAVQELLRAKQELMPPR